LCGWLADSAALAGWLAGWLLPPLWLTGWLAETAATRPAPPMACFAFAVQESQHLCPHYLPEFSHASETNTMLMLKNMAQCGKQVVQYG